MQIDDKITVEIDKLEIPMDSNSSKESSSTAPTPEEIMEYIRLFQLAFERIEVKELKVGEYVIDILYEEGELLIERDRDIVQADLDFSGDVVSLDILKLHSDEFNISLSGRVLADKNSRESRAKFDISIENELNLSIYGRMLDFRDVQVAFQTNKIETLTPLFKLLNLGNSAYIWGDERANYRYIELKGFTNFSIEKPLTALDELRSKGGIEELGFTFEPAVSPVHIDRVEIAVKDSNLHIKPRGLKYGSNLLDVGVVMKSLYSKPHLVAVAKGDLKIDKTLQRTIRHYSGMEQIPVSISSPMRLDYQLDMKLFDDMAMNFVADIEIPESYPKSKELPNINRGDINFLFPENRLNIRNLKFSYGDLASGVARGQLNIPTAELDFNIDIDKIRVDENTTMVTDRLSAKVGGEFNSTISVAVSQTDWKLANLETNLSSFSVDVRGNLIDITNLGIDIDEFNLSTINNIAYDLSSKVILGDIGIDNLKFSEIQIEKEIFETVVELKDEIEVRVPKLGTDVKVGQTIDINLSNIALFREYIPMTNRYPEFSGRADVEIDDKNISINSQIEIPQKIIKLNGERVNELNISGDIVGESIKLSINDRIFIDKGEKVDIFIDDYDFNITGLNDFIDMNSSKDEEESDENVSINIEPEINLYLRGTKICLTEGNNRLSTKKIFATASGDSTILKITPPRGDIDIESRNDRYIVKATNLAGSFIKDITAFDGLTGGDFNLYMKGTGGDFEGLTQFRTLKIKDMEFVNNILAFINTVPALLTFSRPGFNHNGLRVMAGFVEFQKDGDIVYLKEFQIKGENIDFFGKGYIDLKKEALSIQIDISAVKYVDKIIENIPVANYLILGDDGSISTRIVVRGKLDDPKISTEVHKDILFTPLELSKRALNLPAKILEIFKELNINDRENQKHVKEFFNNFK